MKSHTGRGARAAPRDSAARDACPGVVALAEAGAGAARESVLTGDSGMAPELRLPGLDGVDRQADLRGRGAGDPAFDRSEVGALDHLRAHPELGRHVRVSVVGEGPYGATLSAALHDTPHLADSLVLEGWQDPAEALARHDVLLLASRFEGVPLVMLEAMAAGVPVVSTDLPGTRPYLPETCLFPFGRLDAAFDIVHALHRDATRRADVIAHNRASFDTLASGPAFEAGVQRLTRDLAALGARA